MSKRVQNELSVTLEVTNTNISAAAMRVILHELAEHPEDDVLAALKACRTQCKGRLSLADILERMPNRPMAADAAWDLAVRENVWDEGVTLVVPKAVYAAAMAASGSWENGDHVAARMAFKAAYPAAVHEHGAEMFVSRGYQRTAPDGTRLGDTPEDATRKLEDARARSYVGESRATHMLPSSRRADGSVPMPDHIREQFQAIVGKWGAAKEEESPEARRECSRKAQAELREKWEARA